MKLQDTGQARFLLEALTNCLNNSQKFIDEMDFESPGYEALAAIRAGVDNLDSLVRLLLANVDVAGQAADTADKQGEQA